MNMHKLAEEKNENKQTNISLVYYSQEWAFFESIDNTYLLWIIFITSIVLCL
jgi:hypothetical protein